MFRTIKSFLTLLLALIIALLFGGTAYFMINTSKGARFERLDQPAAGEE